jgi:ATP-dependent helicase HrpB
MCRFTVLSLPIDIVLPTLIHSLRNRPSVVVQAPTGAGKTTRVPPALLDARLTDKRIIMLEPRRLAARAAARRMASERDGRLGDEIGYHVRFDRKFGPQTRILVVTEGLLVRMLHDDPFLESVGIVIFDEFHERSLDTDLALGMVRLLQQTVRPDLRIVVMSATLAVDAVALYLGNGPIVASEGRLFPVEIDYQPRRLSDPWPVAVAEAVKHLLERTDGDVLAFLPGLQEIRHTARHLEDVAEEKNVAILPLHGDLPAEQQDAALLPQDRRKVVLATNVAETSVTVEGITGVVDSGLARTLSFDANVGLDRLQLLPISKASAEQRTGRAGRTRPGRCVRLWSEASHRSRADQIVPEIQRVDLAGAVLNLLCLGETDILQFPWFEQPPVATVRQAMALLRRLGAVDNSGVTALGHTLARLPVHPRLGRLLVEGHRWGHADSAALAAAVLSERSPFSRSLDQPPPKAPEHVSPSDVLDRVHALEEYEKHGKTTFALGALNRGAAKHVLHVRDQLLRMLRNVGPGPGDRPPQVPPGERDLPQTTHDADEAVQRALLAAFPDRLARRREPGSRHGRMVGGRGVRLAPVSGVIDAELFLCIDVDSRQTEALVRQASAVQRDWLPPEDVKTSIDVDFDPESERVVARKRVRFDDLILEESSASFSDEEQAARVLAGAAAEHLDRVLPPPDSTAGFFLLRLRCLREWMPELQLPAFDANDMREILPWLCPGRRSFADLRKADWLGAIHGKLTHAQRQAVDREAPERLAVPSGSHIILKYEVGRPPILAVRIQEMFGLRDTPRVAGGRVPVLLHLLAPNYRPQQVTDDLASFWTNIYPQIRKELRARYPKHAWPEDPWTAPAVRGPKRNRPTP